MSQWARENPEWVGTDRDPYMQNAGYREAMRTTPRVCNGCACLTTALDNDGLCRVCSGDDA